MQNIFHWFLTEYIQMIAELNLNSVDCTKECHSQGMAKPLTKPSPNNAIACLLFIEPRKYSSNVPWAQSFIQLTEWLPLQMEYLCQKQQVEPHLQWESLKDQQTPYVFILHPLTPPLVPCATKAIAQKYYGICHLLNL